MFKACPWKVKGQDLVVNRSRVREDRGTGGVAMPPERRTGPSYMRGGVVAFQRGGTRLRGVAPLTDGDDTVVDVLR